MSNTKTVAIRWADFERLKKMSKQQGRPMTEILHRALEAFSSLETKTAK